MLELAGEFPPRIALGENTVGWFECEVRDWLAARAERPAVKAQGARAANVATYATDRTSKADAKARPVAPVPTPHGPAATEAWMRVRMADGEWHVSREVMADGEKAGIGEGPLHGAANRLCEKRRRGSHPSLWRLRTAGVSA
jgi:hypothetical protein